MTTAEILAQLPDDHPVYVPGVGEFTVDQVRSTESGPKESQRERDFRTLERLVTENLCRETHGLALHSGPERRE